MNRTRFVSSKEEEGNGIQGLNLRSETEWPSSLSISPQTISRMGGSFYHGPTRLDRLSIHSVAALEPTSGCFYFRWILANFAIYSQRVSPHAGRI